MSKKSVDRRWCGRFGTFAKNPPKNRYYQKKCGRLAALIKPLPFLKLPAQTMLFSVWLVCWYLITMFLFVSGCLSIFRSPELVVWSVSKKTSSNGSFLYWYIAMICLYILNLLVWYEFLFFSSYTLPYEVRIWWLFSPNQSTLQIFTVNYRAGYE